MIKPQNAGTSDPHSSRSVLEHRVNDHRRDQLTAEIRRKIGAADQEIRQGYAEISKIRQAQGQRRIMRPNL